MKKISVCMIVKNEEKVLVRCLDCVKKIADEIVIVDTGSTDKTTEIAKKYTQKVYYLKWQDDFSFARNFSIQMCTCDYIMWIDADDTISKKNIDKINKLKETMQSDTYMMKYQVSFDEKNIPTFEFYRERILKNCASCRFSGFIHEAIVPFGKIEYLDISIEHHKIEKERDKKRNLKIYNKHLKIGEKFNAREVFYYSRELFYNGYYKKTIQMLKRFLKFKDKFLPNTIDAFVTISDCYLYQNNFFEAKKYLYESFNYAVPNAYILSKIGQIFIKQNELKNAIFWYKSALNSQKNENNGEFFQKDYYDFIPYLQLSFCYYYIGDYQNFQKYHNLAKKIKPYDKTIIYNEKFIKK